MRSLVLQSHALVQAQLMVRLLRCWVEGVKLSIIWSHLFVAPAPVAQLRPGIEVPLCRVYYSCDIDGGRPPEDLSSRLRDLSAIKLILHLVCQHSHRNIHLIVWKHTCDSL